jgi:hypothetical protein
MLAPFWADLNPDPNTNNGYGDIYYYNDTLNHRWIVEFKDCAHYDNTSQRETFQAILLDPQYYQTPTEDGEILYLYANVANATSTTIGMEDHLETNGLQYLYENTYDPNAAPLVANRALLITTHPPGSRVNTPWLYTLHYAISDSAGGNNNNIAEPGEIIDLYITIKNDGDTTAYNVDGILMCNEPDATILDSSANFGTIAAGATMNNVNDPYTVQISDTPGDTTIGFSLNLECNNGSYTKQDYFTIYLYGEYGIEEYKGNQMNIGLQVYPNPSRQISDIRFQILDPSQAVSLRIYDVTGRLVKQFLLSTDYYLLSTISWDGTDEHGRRVSEGIYFVRLETHDYTETQKIIFLK